MPNLAAPLVRVERGEVEEAIQLGHLAVADAAGRVHASLGDPAHLTYFRSCAKPFQAIPMVVEGAAAAFGSLLSLKVILDLREGKADAIEKVRTRERGLAKLEELVEARTPPGARIHAAVLHVNAPDRGRLLGEWVQERYHCVEYWVDEAGPVLASHAGPGAVALGWYQEEHGA